VLTLVSFPYQGRNLSYFKEFFVSQRDIIFSGVHISTLTVLNETIEEKSRVQKWQAINTFLDVRAPWGNGERLNHGKKNTWNSIFSKRT